MGEPDVPGTRRFLPVRFRNLAPRMAAGTFVFHSGWSKRNVPEEEAVGLHEMASGAFPFLRRLPADVFVRLLSTTEMAVGSALLLPIVPNRLAGAALAGFSSGLLTVYARTPGMRRAGSIWPTPDGTAMAKDAWLLGIGLGLLADGGRVAEPGGGSAPITSPGSFAPAHPGTGIAA